MVTTSSGELLPSPLPPSDYEFNSIRQGNKIVAELLIRRWDPIIKTMCRRYSTKPTLLEDLEHEGRIAIWRSILQFDQSTTTPFAHYAKRAIRNRCLKFLKGDTSNRRELPDEEVLKTDRRRTEQPESLSAMLKKESERKVGQFVADLPVPLQRIYTTLYETGLTQREAADRLKLSQPRISQLHKQLKNLGRKALLNYCSN